MDVMEFEDLVNRLGEDMSSWPDAERHAGTIPLTSSPAPRALIERARALRAALAAAAVRAPSGLVSHVVVVVARKLKIGSLDAKEDAAVPAVCVTGRSRYRCEQ
jgi:hypothetical protein